MTTMIKFSVPTEPVPFKRVMTNGKRRYNDPRYSDFKYYVGLHARNAMHGAPFLGAVKMHVDFYKRTPKNPCSQRWGDGDNFLKAVMDALQGVCYLNDAQVLQGTFTKNHGDPHIVIELEEINHVED